jgi:hypothetical protein
MLAVDPVIVSSVTIVLFSFVDVYGVEYFEAREGGAIKGSGCCRRGADMEGRGDD